MNYNNLKLCSGSAGLTKYTFVVHTPFSTHQTIHPALQCFFYQRHAFYMGRSNEIANIGHSEHIAPPRYREHIHYIMIQIGVC